MFFKNHIFDGKICFFLILNLGYFRGKNLALTFSYYTIIIIVSFAAVLFPPQSQCSWQRPTGQNVLFIVRFVLRRSSLTLLYTSHVHVAMGLPDVRVSCLGLRSDNESKVRHNYCNLATVQCVKLSQLLTEILTWNKFKFEFQLGTVITSHGRMHMRSSCHSRY